MRYAPLLAMLMLTWFIPAQAREVAGVAVPETITLHAGETQLALNGAGVRRKLFMSIYVGALYLPQAAGDVDSVLSMPGSKRFSMHFVYKEVSPEKLIDAWNEGFQDNLSPETFRALRPRIANFNGMFPALRAGDRVDIDITSGKPTQLWINDKQQGKISGDDFAKALLGIWLGDKPADKSLKRALLGDY